MDIILDATLEPVVPQSKYGEDDQHALNAVLKATMPTDEKLAPVKTIHTIPSDATIYHSSYLGYLSRTYAMHSSIVFKPDTLWYSVLCEIASVITADPETYRSIFTSSPDKIDIVVEGVDAFELPIAKIKAELISLVPVDIDLFLPTFTTTTEMDEFSMLASFLETVSPYYNYSMYMCGHPSVRVLGTTADWELIEDRLQKLSGELLPLAGWLGTLITVVGQIKQSIIDEDIQFWKNIFTETRCGSGGQTEVNGWFASMIINQPQSPRYLGNFPTHITKVPYTVIGDDEHNYELCCGMFSSLENFGFMIPSFSTVVNQYNK